MELSEKYFNVAGPCNPARHYMLPAAERLPGVEMLIRRDQYFVIRAARQSGKTTALKAFTNRINAAGARIAVYCTLEEAQGFTDPEAGAGVISDIILRAAACYGPPAVFDPPRAREAGAPGEPGPCLGTRVRETLTAVARAAGKPLVVFFDEVDCLGGQMMISFLRQLRAGYVNRDVRPFPASVALVGMRDIRDYRAQIRPDGQTLGSASPFNIVTETLTLRDFSEEEVARLYGQHTEATGQAFTPEAVREAWRWTRGQPWLVNALARGCVEELHRNNYAEPVTAGDMAAAKDAVIRRRDTHIDSLMERLKEKRIRDVVEPVITGGDGGPDPLSDDCRYVLDLGLLREERGTLVPSNPIYAEVILRVLSWAARQAGRRPFCKGPRAPLA